jgi:broad specificity phosphatase PhoE
VAERRPEVVVVRHGETEWTRTKRHTGRTDVPLTDTGRRQGEVLGHRLAGRSFALVLSSPRQRCHETCRLAGFGDAADVSEDLVEWDYGALEGRTTEDIRAERPGWSVWREGAPGGETAAQVGARADVVIERLRRVEGDALVFSHGHFLRVLAARWVGLPATAGNLLLLSPGALGTLGWEREVRVVGRWNDDCPSPVSG